MKSDVKGISDGDQVSGPLLFWDAFGIPHINSGVGQHWTKLSRAILLMKPSGNSPSFENCFDFPKSISKIPFSGISRLVWNRLLGEKLRKLDRCSYKIVFHGFSNFNIPITSGRRKFRTVLTVHDVIPLIQPQSVSWKLRTEMQYILRNGLKHVDHVVCVSHWSKMTFLSLFDYQEERVSVIPNGFGEFSPRIFKPDEGSVNVLMVSRYERYKGFEFLCNVIRKNRRFKLAIVTNEIGRNQLERFADDLIRQGRLTIFVTVSNDLLHSLYNKTDVYVTPSRFEGFCLPVAESLSHNIPVVYLKGSGIDEVAGGSVAIGLEGLADESDWSDAILQAYQMNFDSGFLELGSAYVQSKLSWEGAADKINQLYGKMY